MSPLRVAIVGFGKIARDQHVPAIAATDGVELVAVASRNASLPADRRGGAVHPAAGSPRAGGDGAGRRQARDAGKAAGRDGR